MIKAARVSLSTVNTFKSSIENLVSFSNILQYAKDELADLLNQLTIMEDTARESITNTGKAKEIIDEKIHEIHKLLDNMYGTRDELINQIETVEIQLDSVPEYITEYDNEGYSYETENPDYSSLQHKLSSLESKLDQLDQEIFRQENRMEKAERLESDVSETKRSLNDAISTLEQEKTECRQTISEMDEIHRFTRRDGEYVIEKLGKIETAIEEYSAVKIEIDNSLAFNKLSDISVNQMINISINIDQTERTAEKNDDSELESKTEENNTEFFDDNGNLYRIGDELVKNNSYQINEYKYETDWQGRIKSASGKLNIDKANPARKMGDNIKVIGKGDELKTDDRGHIIAHRFNGSDGMENLVAQDQYINRNDYARLEEHLAEQVSKGNDVNVNIIPFYDPESSRPLGIFYFYTINGIAHSIVFPNRKIEA